MTTEWSELETGRHQDHIIAHVLGATTLSYFEFDLAVHLLLDIGFFWTIFVDGEMALVLQSLAVKEFELDDEARAAILADMQLLHAGVRDAEKLSRMTIAPAGCLIKGVEIYAQGERRRILIKCEDVSLAVHTSLSTGEVHVEPVSE
ncbi:MAG TPA: hypothetical protein VKB86_20380 [Pyrinomonadaceae bacterium]|nr:hypothetical protein [Pyrinomonadaceae bacterium]